MTPMTPRDPGLGKPVGAGRPGAQTGRTAGTWRSPGALRLLTRAVAALLVAAACDVPAAFRVGVPVGLLAVAAAGFAWWLAPAADDRPPAASVGRPALARRRAPTVLAAAAVVLAAVTGPPLWLGACVTALLIGYLVLTDPWISGATGPRAPRAARPLAPVLLALGTCAAVFAAAVLPLSHHRWTRLLAVLVLAATAAVLLLALLHPARPDDDEGRPRP